MDPLITRTLSIAFGVLMFMAALHKLRGMAVFRAVVLDYRLLPPAFVPAAAAALAGAELLIGMLWFAGSSVTTVAAAFATVLLLAGYALAIAINLLRGRVHISCGCGLSGSGGERLSWGLVGRNAVLLLFAVAAAFPTSARELQWMDYVTLVAALSAITLLYTGTATLLGNAAAISTWRNTRD